MAMNQMKIQQMAFKQKAAKASDKLDKAVFGMGYGGMTMANGGYVAGKHGYGGFKMADGGPVVNAHMIAGDGLIGRALAAHKDAIEAAASGPTPAAPAPRGPAPALRPATPENPGDVLRAEANRIAARNAAAAAPAPAPTLMQRAKSVFGMAAGGPVVGPGGPTEDKVPAMLSHGEYVMPADTVKAVGKENLDIIRHATHKPVNKARFGMADGGSLEDSVRNFVQSGVQKIPGYNAARDATASYNAGADKAAGQDTESPEFKASMANAMAQDNPYDVVATPAAILPGSARAATTVAPGLVRRAAGGVADAATSVYGRVRSAFGRAAPATAGEAAAPVAAAAEAPAARAAAGRITVAGSVPAAVATSQFGAPGTESAASSQAPSASSSAPSAPNSGLAGFYNDNPDVRRAVVQANRPDTDQHDLGDYGSAGSQIFGQASAPGGKINSFSGKGSGQHVPDAGLGSGVLTPAQVEADRQLNIARANAAGGSRDSSPFVGTSTRMGPGTPDNQALGGAGPTGPGMGPQLSRDAPGGAQSAGAVDQFGYPAAPNYQVSPEAERARAQIADLSNQLATLQPGDVGRKRLAGQIASLTAAASDLSAADERKNAFGLTKYSHQVQRIQNERMLANQAIGYGVTQQGNEYNYDAKMAEVRNASHKQAMDEKQQRYSNELPQLEALGGGDKDLANQIKVAAGTRLFPTSDGKFVPISELQGKDKARAYGVFQKDVDSAKALKDKGLPYSLSGEDVDKPATGLGFAHALITDPVNSFRFGTTETGGNFRTGRANTLPTHEAHAARKASFGTSN